MTLGSPELSRQSRRNWRRAAALRGGQGPAGEASGTPCVCVGLPPCLVKSPPLPDVWSQAQSCLTLLAGPFVSSLHLFQREEGRKGRKPALPMWGAGEGWGAGEELRLPEASASWSAHCPVVHVSHLQTMSLWPLGSQGQVRWAELQVTGLLSCHPGHFAFIYFW